MTNQAPANEPHDANSPSDERKLPDETLNTAIQYFEEIRRAARSCVDNFTFLMSGAGSSEYMPCLDFDIIAAALFDTNETPSTKSRHLNKLSNNKTERPSVQRPKTSLKIDLGSMAGPAVLEFFVRRMKQIALPSGAMAELVAFHERLRAHTTERARGILRILKDIESPNSLASRKLSELRAIPISDQFMTAVQEIVASSRRLGFVNALVERARPLEEIAHEVRDEQGLFKTFNLAYQHLMSARPEYSRSNFFDAWNCAQVAKANESPTRLAVLVTNTAPVVRAIRLLELQQPVERPRYKRCVVTNLRVTILFENLLEKSGNLTGAPKEFVYRAARTEAWSLFTEASSVARRLDACRGRPEAGRWLDERKQQAILTSNWIAGVDTIQTAYPEFQQRWGGLVGRFDQVYKLDAAMMMARIDTPRVRWWMDNVSSEDRSRLVRSLEQRLEEIKVDEDNRTSLLRLCYRLRDTAPEEPESGWSRIINWRRIYNTTARLMDIRFSDPEPPRFQGDLARDADSADRRYAAFVPAAADELCFLLDSFSAQLETLVTLSFVPADPTFSSVWKRSLEAFQRILQTRVLATEVPEFVHRIAGGGGLRFLTQDRPATWERVVKEVSSTPTDVAVFCGGHAISLTTAAGVSGEYRLSYTFPLECAPALTDELSCLVSQLGSLKLPLERHYAYELNLKFQEFHELAKSRLPESSDDLASDSARPVTQERDSGRAAAADRQPARRGFDKSPDNAESCEQKGGPSQHKGGD